MEPYYYLILFVSVSSLFACTFPDKDKSNLAIAFIGFSSIILLQSIRKWTVGIDIVTYLMFFERLANSENISSFTEEFYTLELGFVYFNKVIAFFTTDNQLFLSIISASIFIPIGYVIYKNSKNIYLSIISLIGLGIFNFTFSGIRQSIAIAIAFLSFEFIKTRKWVWFLILVYLASTFHQSALVFLLGYPLYYLKIRKKHFIVIACAILAVFLFKSFLLQFFVSSVFDKYDNSELLVSTGAYTMFLLLFFIYCTSMFLVNNEDINPPLNAYRNYILIATLIQISASESQVAMRAGFYYFIFLSLLLPELVQSIPDKRLWPGLTFIASLACLIFYYLTTAGSSLDPYLFYWE